MKYVLLVYQGTTPLPGTDRWKALPAAEQKQIYADYAELNEAPGMSPGLPLGLPDAARTVQVRDGKVRSRTGRTWARGRNRRLLRVRGGEHGGGDRPGRAHPGGPARRRGGDPAGREVLVEGKRWTAKRWTATTG